MVKRLILIITAVILALSLLSCSSIQYAMINEKETAKTHFQQIIDALEKKDKEGLKKVFAPNALKEAKDIDSSIDSVMELYKGRMRSMEDAMVTSDSKSEGIRTKELECSYKVKTDNGYYRVYFIDKLIDSGDSGNVGIYTIKVVKDTKEPEFFYWGDGTESPGIFIETAN